MLFVSLVGLNSIGTILDIAQLGVDVATTTLNALGDVERKIVISLGNLEGVDWQGLERFTTNIVSLLPSYSRCGHCRCCRTRYRCCCPFCSSCHCCIRSALKFLFMSTRDIVFGSFVSLGDFLSTTASNFFFSCCLSSSLNVRVRCWPPYHVISNQPSALFKHLASPPGEAHLPCSFNDFFSVSNLLFHNNLSPVQPFVSTSLHETQHEIQRPYIYND